MKVKVLIKMIHLLFQAVVSVLINVLLRNNFLSSKSTV